MGVDLGKTVRCFGELSFLIVYERRDRVIKDRRDKQVEVSFFKRFLIY